MASIIRGPNGRKTIQFTHPKDKKRRPKVGLGKVTLRQAEFVKSKIERLIASVTTGDALDTGMARWVAELPPDLSVKLSKAGLVASTTSSQIERVKSFIDAYLEGREDAAENTTRNWHNSRNKLVGYFGDDKWLHEISAGDADDWRQWLMNTKYSDATISKAVKHAKQFLALAERKGLVQSNPFRHLRAGGEENEDRKAFVERKIVDRVIEHAPDTQWKLIIALARYGGALSERSAVAYVDGYRQGG